VLGNTKHLKKNLGQPGFSIVELLVVTAISGLLIASAITVMMFFYGDVLRSNIQSRLAVESQNILRAFVEELRVSSGIKDSNSISDPNSPVGGWLTSNENLILIISTPVLDSNNDFVIDPLTGSPYQNEIIYFADGNRLYRRYLGNPSADGNIIKTTCPIAMATSSCPADAIMSENFNTMNFIFYDRDDIQTLVLADAKSIKLHVKMLRRSFGKDIEFENNIRITLRNTVL